MEFKQLGDVISKFAPLLGKVISTGNPVVAILVNIIANLFKADRKDYQDIIEKINSDSDAKLKLIQLEFEHREILNKNQLEDRKDARSMEREIIIKTGKRDKFIMFVAALMFVGYLVCIYIMPFFNDNKQCNSTCGSVLVGQILGYYFGD